MSASSSVDSAVEWRARHARPVRSALAASDLHLWDGDPEGVQRAAAFVEQARSERVDALYLLGDVFRAWLGPASLHDPGLQPFLEALRAAATDGVGVTLLHGNHDFLLGPHVERALGVRVVPDGVSVRWGGLRARLMHGDALCTRDRDSLRLQRVLRAPITRRLLSALPARGLQGLADRLTGASLRATSAKSDEIMAIVDDEVALELQAGHDLLVCGHVHRARDARIGAGRLVVLADFETTGSHARLEQGELQLLPRDSRFAPPPGPVVTLDGPAGSGKSSVAVELARRLGWGRLDSGALYRAITLKVLAAGWSPDGPEAGARIDALAAATLVEVEHDGRVTLDGASVRDAELRGPEVSAAVSAVSARPAVRAALLDVQHFARRRFGGLIAEGRDMASVVFPDATLTVWVDARLEVRAARRAAQHAGDGVGTGAVAAALARRDAFDSGRAVAPLVRPPGALVVDSSEESVAAIVTRLLEELARRGLAPGAQPSRDVGLSPPGPVR